MEPGKAYSRQQRSVSHRHARTAQARRSAQSATWQVEDEMESYLLPPESAPGTGASAVCSGDGRPAVVFRTWPAIGPASERRIVSYFACTLWMPAVSAPRFRLWLERTVVLRRTPLRRQRQRT